MNKFFTKLKCLKCSNIKRAGSFILPEANEEARSLTVKNEVVDIDMPLKDHILFK